MTYVLAWSSATATARLRCSDFATGSPGVLLFLVSIERRIAQIRLYAVGTFVDASVIVVLRASPLASIVLVAISASVVIVSIVALAVVVRITGVVLRRLLLLLHVALKLVLHHLHMLLLVRVSVLPARLT